MCRKILDIVLGKFFYPFLITIVLIVCDWIFVIRFCNSHHTTFSMNHKICHICKYIWIDANTINPIMPWLLNYTTFFFLTLQDLTVDCEDWRANELGLQDNSKYWNKVVNLHTISCDVYRIWKNMRVYQTSLQQHIICSVCRIYHYD